MNPALIVPDNTTNSRLRYVCSQPQPDIRHTFASVLREYTRVTYDKRKEDEMYFRTLSPSPPALIMTLIMKFITVL